MPKNGSNKKTQRRKHKYTMSQKCPPFIFSNSSVKNWPMLMIFGRWNPEKIWNENLVALVRHFRRRVHHISMSHALPCSIGIVYAMGRFSNGTEQSIKDNQSMNGVTDRESCEDIRSGAFAEAHHFLHSEHAAKPPPWLHSYSDITKPSLGLGRLKPPPPNDVAAPSNWDGNRRHLASWFAGKLL